MRLRSLFVICTFAVMLGCNAEDVRNDKPRTAEDEAFIKQLDDTIQNEEQGEM